MNAKHLLLVCAAACGPMTEPPAGPGAYPPGAEPADWFQERSLESLGLQIDEAEVAAAASPGLGISAGDVDGDGLLDLLVVGAGRRPQLFVNRGALGFADATDGAGLHRAQRSDGCALADVTGDAALDVLLVGTGHLTIHEGRGDGTFGASMSLADSERLGRAHGLHLGDFDLDGRTDILTVGWRAPDDKSEAHANRLYLNRGDGRFEEQIGPGEGFTWVAASISIGDGAPHLFIGNDTFVIDDGVIDRVPASALLQPDAIFRNEGGTFVDVGASALVDHRSTMGAIPADLDGDGRLDLYVSDYGENDALIQSPDGAFVDRTQALGLGSTRRLDPECPADVNREVCLLVSWGAAAEDFDLDGHTDLLVVNGHLAATELLAQPAASWKGGPNGYTPVTLGLPWMNGRSLLSADLDGDGDLDLVTTGWDRPLRVFENIVTERGWLKVRLRGDQSNSEGLGALVHVELDDGRVLVRQVGGGGVVHAFGAATAHFGLGRRQVVDLRIRWPDGSEQRLGPQQADRVVTVAEATK